MLLKTHLAISAFAMILFVSLVKNPFVFLIMCIFGTILPDMDTPFSGTGKVKIARLFQVFTRHRGFIHSLTFCFALSLILAIFLPITAFGFFLGYSLHLIADGFTKDGISPFWPYSKKAFGKIKTGGVVEKGALFVFVIADFILLMFTLLK